MASLLQLSLIPLSTFISVIFPPLSMIYWTYTFPWIPNLRSETQSVKVKAKESATFGISLVVIVVVIVVVVILVIVVVPGGGTVQHMDRLLYAVAHAVTVRVIGLCWEAAAI